MSPNPLGRWLAAILAVGALAVSWSGLYRGEGAGRLLALCVVALLPTLAARAPRARGAAIGAALALAALTVAALATRSSPIDLLALDGDAWSAVRAILPDGLAQGSDSGLPVGAANAPALVALLDVALAALCGAAAWQIVERGRPVAGVVVIGVGLAYRWTVEPPASSAGAAVLALVVIAAILALATWEPEGSARPLRRAGGAAVLGGAAIALAAGLGTGPAQAGDGWWSWKDWEIGGSDAGLASLDLRQRYGALDWPSTPRVALTVSVTTPRPIRAVSLDGFDGEAFTLVQDGGSRAIPIRDGIIRPAPRTGAATHSEEALQRITLVGASTPIVLASGRPESISGPFSGTADVVGDAIRVGEALGPGDRYTVRTRVPQPSPTDLVGARALNAGEVPEGETSLRPGLGGAPVDIPLWGSGVPGPEDAALGPYAPVRALAREVAGDARTQYAAVNRIEAHLRRLFTYDEAPPYPTSRPAGGPAGADVLPPLVDFLLSSRRGFCQHFAGSMAVMLRSIGIPARVAVGYTGGRFDAALERYVVLDRDAHSWVEVWFADRGWLPFDPTPGRSAPNPASVSSPDYAPSTFEVNLGGLVDQAVDPSSPAPGEPEPETAPAEAAAPAAGGGGDDWRWALLSPLVLLLLAPAARVARRTRARRHGDERERVIAAARELETSLAPLGWAPPATASAGERADAVRASTGVDPSSLYRRAALARYAPEPPARGEAVAAWRDLGRTLRAIRRRAPLGRRVASALGLSRRRRDTVTG